MDEIECIYIHCRCIYCNMYMNVSCAGMCFSSGFGGLGGRQRHQQQTDGVSEGLGGKHMRCGLERMGVIKHILRYGQVR